VGLADRSVDECPELLIASVTLTRRRLRSRGSSLAANAAAAEMAAAARHGT